MDYYLIIYKNGITYLTRDKELTEKIIHTSANKAWSAFYVMINNSEAERLLKEGLTTFLTEKDKE
ncbi:hypothetical protein HYW75_05945 [Candidatus Pacearchaeota archaeon]|nr:hypothetical protein [Candidatus Pacearchaeota archaeon]